VLEAAAAYTEAAVEAAAAYTEAAVEAAAAYKALLEAVLAVGWSAG
jgi:hypothetical protein